MQSTTILTLRKPDTLLATINAAGLTAPQAAKQAGLHPSRIYQLAQGHSPSVAAPAALALAAALDVDVRTLFTFLDGPELVRLGLIDG